MAEAQFMKNNPCNEFERIMDYYDWMKICHRKSSLNREQMNQARDSGWTLHEIGGAVLQVTLRVFEIVGGARISTIRKSLSGFRRTCP